jgi:hypothetical protein
MIMSEMDRRAVEQWFRRRGLPSVVRGLEKNLLVRIVPAVVWLALADVRYDVLEHFEVSLAGRALYLVWHDPVA